MEVKVVDSGPCRKLLEVSAPADEVKGDYAHVLNAYTKKGKVPGFRPGKAPLPLIKKTYAKDIVEDARDRAVPRLYHAALKQESIRPVSIINVTDLTFDPDSGVTFKVTVDVPPDFDLPSYAGIVLADETDPVTDEDVDAGVMSFRNRLGSIQAVTDRPAATGDFLMVDFTASCEGQALTELAPDDVRLGSANDFMIALNEPEFLPGFNQGLAGASLGETRVFAVHFPGEYPVAVLAGKTAEYRVTVKTIRQRVPAEITPEFLAMLGVESEADLHGMIRKQLTTDAERREIERRRNEIIKFLVSNTTLDIPQSVVDEERQVSLRSIINRFSESGGNTKALNEHREEIWKMATQTAVGRVKVNYILSRIAEAENIEVMEAEIEARIRALATHYRTTPERLKRDLEKNHGMDSLSSDILSEKTLDLLLSKANIN